jgi:monothiol glutaredoxin
MARAILTQDRLDTAIEPKIGGYHAETVAEVQAAVAANRIVVVGMRGNPHVK